jgi:hypothetical protein
MEPRKVETLLVSKKDSFVLMVKTKTAPVTQEVRSSMVTSLTMEIIQEPAKRHLSDLLSDMDTVFSKSTHRTLDVPTHSLVILKEEDTRNASVSQSRISHQFKLPRKVLQTSFQKSRTDMSTTVD